MKRTIVYIDGFNLYYGLLKGTGAKWLDLVAFSKALLRDDHDIVAVKYFTAPIKTHPRDLPAKCQLPDVVEVGTHGHLIHRPAAWS